MNNESVTSVSEVARHRIVWAAEPGGAAPIVTELCQGGELELLEDLAAVPGKLLEWPDAGILLLYLSPIETLCREMRAGMGPSRAMLDWQLQAQQILTLKRRNRRQVQLLDVGMVRVHPEAFRQHFQLPGGGAMELLPQQDEILMLIARQLLLGDPQVKRLSNELEAISLNFSSEPGRKDTDLDTAFREYRRLRGARQEADLLLAQTQAAQDEVDALNARQQDLQSAVTEAQKERQQALREAEMLSVQMRVVQEETDALTARQQDLQGAVTEAQKERQQALREAEMLSVQMRMALEEADVLTSRQHELQAALTRAQEQLATGQREWEAALAAVRGEEQQARQETAALAARQHELQAALTRAQEQLVAGRHEWEAALAAAQAKGQQARQEAELFQARARAAQDEMAVLIRRRQSLETELDLAKTESLRAAREEELLQAQVRVMRQELDMSVLERQQLEQRLLQLSQGMESYQTQLTALQAERLALQRRAGEKERSLSAAGASLRDMEMQIHHLRDHLTRVKAEWKEAARLAEERQGLLEEKDNEMRRLLSSKSFRLTAPLRFFRSLLS